MSAKKDIGYASAVLMAVGGLGLIVANTCWFANWSYCQQPLLPLLAVPSQGIDSVIRLNLPASWLLLGLALRSFSQFGWAVSALILAVSTGLFLSLAWYHWGGGSLFSALSDPQSRELAQPWLTAFILNLLLALLAGMALAYLALPEVRKVFSQKGPA